MDKLEQKNIFKSTTFWAVMIIVVLGTVAGYLESIGVKIPQIVTIVIGALGSLYIWVSKVKDAKVTEAKIMATTTDIPAVQKALIINPNAVKVIGGLGVGLTSIYGVLTQYGIHIDPTIIATVSGVIATFVGTEQYKNMRIQAAQHDLPQYNAAVTGSNLPPPPSTPQP